MPTPASAGRAANAGGARKCPRSCRRWRSPKPRARFLRKLRPRPAVLCGGSSRRNRCTTCLRSSPMSTATPRSMTSKRMSSICRTASGWKRIPAWVSGSTIRIMSTPRCTVRRRRMSTISRCATDCSTASRRFGSTPVGDTSMYGRDGILAHPYMLGPNGQSFGCVSFKDYQAFLRAFKKGEVEPSRRRAASRSPCAVDCPCQP